MELLAGRHTKAVFDVEVWTFQEPTLCLVIFDKTAKAFAEA
jgi:hypothetical protein